MKIKASATIGKAGSGFKWTIETDADDKILGLLASKGLEQITQRNTDIDKILGIVIQDADGKWVRTDKTRSAVQFNRDMAEELADSFSKAMIGSNAISFDSVKVEPYEGEITGPAWKQAVKVLLSLQDTLGMESMLKAIRAKLDAAEATTDAAIAEFPELEDVL